MVKSHFQNKNSFREKIKIFSQEYLECCAYLSNKSNDKYISKISLYSKLTATSQILEDFMVSHGAIKNKYWKQYAKMCSMVNYFSNGAYWQKHIIRCQIVAKMPEEECFGQKANDALLFFNNVLVKIASEIILETKRLNISTTIKTIHPEKFPSLNISDILECNSTIKSANIKKQDIVKIASDFLFLVSNFNKLKFFPYDNSKDLTELIPNRIGSETVKHFELLINNLRTFFNTCIAERNINSTYYELKKLKEYLDIIFYLLQMSSTLFCFYEHHFLEKRCNAHKKIEKELADIINPNKLLYWAVDFGLHYVYTLLNLGEKLARKILDNNIEISSIKVGVPVKFGFHTRPSLLVAKIVQHYGSKVYLEVGNDKFDASSVLNIQWAGGKIQKEKICKVIFTGDTRALEDIKLLASINYGENTMGKGIQMPSALNYLR